MRIVEKWCFPFVIYNAVLENRKYSVVHKIRKAGLYSRLLRPCGIKKSYILFSEYMVLCVWTTLHVKNRYMNLMLFCKEREIMAKVIFFLNPPNIFGWTFRSYSFTVVVAIQIIVFFFVLGATYGTHNLAMVTTSSCDMIWRTQKEVPPRRLIRIIVDDGHRAGAVSCLDCLFL